MPIVQHMPSDLASADLHPTPRQRRVGRGRVIALVGCLALLVGACSAVRQGAEDEVESHTRGTFDALPDPLPAGKPGDIIRSERLLGAPDGAVAYRVLYHSTDFSENHIGVSGTVVVPTGIAPPGGRTVVSWAHPTTGSEPQCGPSAMTDPFEIMEGYHELLAAGYVVASTDYSGMGADGPNSYLIGGTEGRSVLDAARAARNLGGDVHAGTDVLLWGHSQGGQAALFAAQIAPDYAPELTLKGVAAAAPAAELGQLMADHMNDISGVTIGAYAFDAYQRVYGATTPGLTLDDVLTPAAREALPKMVPYCLLTQSKEIHEIGQPLVGNFFAGDPTTIEPWATLLTQNTPGQTPVGVPMLIAQGESDKLVIPATTDGYVQKLCANGEHVQYHKYADIDHGLVGWRAVPAVVGFFADIMAGRAPADTCSTPPSTEPSTPPGSVPGSTSDSPPAPIPAP
jgi:pimeloyl-ACP methyl ester carboxylesterase